MTTTCSTCGRSLPTADRTPKVVSDEVVQMIRTETKQVSRLMDNGLYTEAKERLRKLRVSLSA